MASAFFREIHARKTGLADEPSLQKVYHLKSQAKIIVQEDPDGGVGGSIWDAALSLFNEIETLGQQGQFKGSKIIDLGSGTGILGLVTAAYGAGQVHLTDRFDVVRLLEHNVKLNPDLSALIRCSELEWNGEKEGALEPPFDYIVASECIYNMRYAPALLATVNKLAGPGTVVLFAYASRNPDEERRWFAEDVSLDWEVHSREVPPSSLPVDKPPAQVFLQQWVRKPN